MVLKVTRGYSPDYLWKEVATGRENYYTGAVAAGEPPGRWWGSGAEKIGLIGLVDGQDMRAVYERFLDPRAEGFKEPARWDEVATLGHAGRRYMSEDELYAIALEREPDATPERKTELRIEAGRSARRNVAFFDLTFNVQKSVTLLHTAFEAQEVNARAEGDDTRAEAWAQFRKSVEDAIWAGNNAGLAYFVEHAGYSRIGHHGGAAGRWVDAPDCVVASFFQHDSREHDPHLHIHNAFLNRVLGSDGVWRTIDSRALYKFRTAAAAVAERTTEERLTHALGVLVATRPDGKAREVVGVAPEAMDLISTRRRQVTARTAELVQAFEARHGRAPNGLELDRLAQHATLLTRRAKSHTGESREQLLDRIDSRIRSDIEGGLAEVAHTVLEVRSQAASPQTWSPQAVLELALEEVRAAKSGWTAPDLTAAINRALPDYLGIPDGASVARLLDTLTDEGLRNAIALDAPRPGDALLPAALRLRNGRSAYEAPGARLYATPDHVRTERALIAAATERGAAALPALTAARYVEQLRETGIELGVDQAAAVRGILTSGHRVECLIGPAGTGKSFVVGALAHAWTDPRAVSDNPGEGGAPRRAFGLATSQIATDILADEGLVARNVARWLATQDRLAAVATAPGRPEDEAWRLHAGDLVVVDESAMTDTASLAAIHRHVNAAGAKLLLVGDHRQLAAIGAGGALDLLAHAGSRYELAEARRLRQPWERAASMRLREGDQTVLQTYHQRGRLLDAGSREQAEASAARAWLGDILGGNDSLLLVDDNDAAARLCGSLRRELVRVGLVAEHGIPLGHQGTVAGVGDLVQARSNAWNLAGVEGNRRGPLNRETYRVLAVRDDGSFEVQPAGAESLAGLDDRPAGERLVLPPSYVAEHLALAYASTVHAAQGRTTDTSHAVITSWTSLAALYVALSRGREANTAHVATITTIDDPAQGREDQSVHRDPVAVLADILDAPEPLNARSALAIATESADEAARVRTPAELLADAAQLATTERTARWLDELVDGGHVTPEQRSRIAAEDGAPSLARVLRRAELAGLNAKQILVDAVTDRPLTGAANTTNVIYSRITDRHTRRFDPVGETWADWVPQTDNADWNAYLVALAEAADNRSRDLGRSAAADPPAWAVDALGPVPAAGEDRVRWERSAGLVAAYRELGGTTEATEALGPAPKAGQVEAYAAYRAAWRALGRPEIDRAEDEMSDGQHRARIRAWQREQPWGPRYVGHELAATRQAAIHQRQTAAIRQTEAAAAHDPAERAQLERQAADAAALGTALDDRASQLQQVDDARALWLAHTARTRANAEQSEAVLAERHADDTEPELRVTAEEWLAAHEQAVTEEERHRQVTEDDLADADDALERTCDSGPGGASPAQTRLEDAVLPDLRDVASREPRQRLEDVVRVASAGETAKYLDGASRALAEIHAREADDLRVDSEHRAAELTRWHADDSAAEQATLDADDGLDRGASADDMSWAGPP